MNKINCDSRVNPNSYKNKNKFIDIGKCIKIIDSEKNYQIIGINNKRDICWVREWPLNFLRYETFALSTDKITNSSLCEIKEYIRKMEND